MRRLTPKTAIGVLLAFTLSFVSFSGCSQIKEIYCEKIIPAMAGACRVPTPTSN